MKNKRRRLDYTRLAEALSERGLVSAEQVNLAIQDAATTGVPFPEILLTRDLVTDWELSRQVCRVFGLPFLPVDVYPPHEKAIELVDPEFVRLHRLIPIQKFSDVLTVCMPGLVPTAVLTELEQTTELKIAPLVGTVKTNGLWIAENLSGEVAGALPGGAGAAFDSSWGSFFDEADQKVLMELESSDQGLEVVSDEGPASGSPLDGASFELPDISSLSVPAPVASAEDASEDSGEASSDDEPSSE